MKNRNKIYLLLSIVSIVLISFTTYLFFIKKEEVVKTYKDENQIENVDNDFFQYNNTEAGYSFQYPNYFEYNKKSEKPNFIFLNSKIDGADIITISRRSIESGGIKTVEDWAVNMSKEGYYKMQDIIIANVSGIVVLDNVDKTFSFEDRYLNIGFVKDGYIFSINLRGFTEEQMVEFIGNFKFIK